jgi:hypothetical protein
MYLKLTIVLPFGKVAAPPRPEKVTIRASWASQKVSGDFLRICPAIAAAVNP